MFLPPELLTLVFLTGLTAVNAQVDDTAAPTYTPASDVPSLVTTPTSAPPLSPTGDSNDIGAPAPTPTADDPPLPTDDIYPCDLPEPPDWCEPPPFWHPEESATGWDDWASWNNDGIGGGNNIAPPTPTLRPVEQTPDVVTTVTPTVIEIRTSVEPSAPGVVDGDATPQPQIPNTVPAGDGHTEKQEPSAQPTPGQDAPQTKVAGGGNVPQGSPIQPTPGPAAPTIPAPGAPAPGAPAPGQSTAGTKPNTVGVPAQRQSASTGTTLLDTIINHLGKAQPGTQPTQAIPRTTGGPGEPNSQEHATSPTDTAKVGPGGSAQDWEVTSGQVTPGPTNTASSQDSIAAGNTITLGSATLSLTPGLSTMVGTGTDTTLIAIQTDGESHTIITISSSGTAITATITNAPATVTLPKSGFEASITGDAGRGVATSRVAVTAVTTSSKGVANDKRVSIGGLSGFVVGILGFVAIF